MLQVLDIRYPVRIEEVMAQEGNPHIEGNVVSKGKPVAGARITLIRLPSPKEHRPRAKIIRLRSDANGHFMVEDAVPGRYIIVVRKRHFVPAVGRFRLPPGKSVRLRVELFRRRLGAIIPILLPY